MNSTFKTGTYLLTGIAMLVSASHAVQAQQVDPFRPAIGVGDEGTENRDTNTSITAPVQQTNAPQPIRLLSNQPQSQEQPAQTTRRQPEADPFQPIGIRAGSFRLFPVLELTSDFSDNVRTDPSGKTKDVGLRIAPSLRLQSDWTRHSLDLNVSGETVFYTKANDQNSNTFNAASNLRFDIRRDVNLLQSVTYQLSETSSASSEVPGTAIGDRVDHELTYTSALTGRFNRLVATVTGGIDWLFFDDVKLAGGGKENNKDREYIEPSARLRLGYDISPAVTPFVEAGFNPRIHRKTRDRNGTRRDSIGLTASAGFGFNLSPIWDGTVALTYDHRNFDDSTLSNIDSFGISAAINWRPSQLTTVTLVTTTDIDEVSTVGVSGSRNYGIDLDISHRFRENLTGSLDFGFNYQDFIGGGGNDMNFTVDAGVAYAINRRLEWIANYQFNRFKSGTPGSSYTENRISTGVRFRL